ncbi:MAG: GIY-YIG nuclease family protein [Planctomycetota bacterium]
MSGGVYIAVFHLPRARRLKVGRLGVGRFRPGFYLYVGSAQRNLHARVERHGRKKKPLRWHVDYLSVRAKMLGAILLAARRPRECELAARLGEIFERAMPGFGASDCRCGGHLFYARRLF